jgi:hypothetical protein
MSENWFVRHLKVSYDTIFTDIFVVQHNLSDCVNRYVDLYPLVGYYVPISYKHLISLLAYQGKGTTVSVGVDEGGAEFEKARSNQDFETNRNMSYSTNDFVILTLN